MENKKILIFLTRIPYPPKDGTRFRILNNVIGGLNLKFKLEFLVVTDEKYNSEQIEYLEKNFGKVFIFKKSKISCMINAFKALFNFNSLQGQYYYFKDVADFFLKNFKNYDGIYIHTLRLGKYIEKIYPDYKERILIDLNDAISLNYQTAKKYASFLWRIIFWIEEKRVQNYEMLLLSKFKYFHVISEFDKKYFLEEYNKLFNKMPDGEIFVTGYGVSENLFNYKWQPLQKNIVFMGNLKYAPNYDAICFFIEKIWNKLKKELKDFNLVIIGSKNKLKFPDSEKLIFTGYIENPYEIISQSYIFISPIRFGAGIQTKILEAMALGVPTITTPIGVRGCKNIQVDKQIFVIDSKNIDEWINKIKFIANNITNKEILNLSFNAREYIRNFYSNEIIQEEYINIFNKIL